MVPIRHVMRSLPLLAAVLGDAYGVEVVIGGDLAHTDGKAIHLPTLPLEGDATVLALARGLLDHEAAHIRETDFEALRHWSSTPFAHHIWNSLEDWRVEQQLADRFPGCRQNLRWLIEHYFTGTGTADRAGDQNPALSILNAILLTVRAWDAPGVQANRDAKIKEVNQAFPGLWAQIQAVLEEARGACRSTQDAIRLAEAIVALVQEEHRRQQRSGESQEHEQEHGDAAVGQRQLKPEADRTEGKEDRGQLAGDRQTEPDACAGVSAGELMNDAPASGCVTTAAKDSLAELLEAAAPTDWPQHLGERLAQSLGEHPIESSDQGLTVARLGSKMAKALEAAERKACLQASVALRTRLYRLLQASRLVRSQPGRHGKFDPKRLHGLAVGDARVFLKLGQKAVINTAVHILLDSSGSMSGAPIKLASQACYAVATALERIKGINVAVSAFPAGTAHDGVTVAPLIKHGEKVHAELDILAEGYTPLAQALWWVLQQMVLLKEDRKLVVIVTDGEPDSVPATHTVLRTAEALGLEVYGIGIQSESVRSLLPRSSVNVKSLSDLPEAMFSLLYNALAQRPAGGRP
ncbi:cobaltochelatase CobT-related protein [Desulfolutivibrio sulfodismutans]|nr:VWA domain-containing protein [Desulfolutivibrio sulfodismutans]